MHIFYIYTYICYHKNNVHSRLSPQWLLWRLITWAHCGGCTVYVYLYIPYYQVTAEHTIRK